MGRVARYKKVKKFDLFDEKKQEGNKPARIKERSKLPHSFRTMKYQKDQMLKYEAIQKQKKLAKESKKPIVDDDDVPDRVDDQRDDIRPKQIQVDRI